LGPIDLTSPGTHDGWDDVDIPILDHSLSKSSGETLKTPKKLKLGPMLSPTTIPFSNFGTEALCNIQAIANNKVGEVLDLWIQHGIRTVMANWNKLKANFEIIRLKLDSASPGENCYHNTVSNIIGQLQDSLNDTD
jgi:hypothetical protein